ncbi:3'-5' exoribonuclease YhaM family protein [Tetragenococcus halophilus]|uniref:3'-5' exoribonuclease YhaM family protein n=1 Tax=Tetragenococcus halophilus TaxID=51669 RepID=UPI001F20AD5B|nr:OB-fold nucleic acid binding domain-containing protein [Tetragenococcus halophilus]MCF1601832.1 OB-fold nucleic acid binding domain-containing protein [Tetragenococcus halophilus]MCF1675740.1 OB-fold nucleic acid binding domain-containing protein [Tetragenococcus halophilus]MDN6113321.1 OB-fold nucleic acid binding domain-containing protein [Tetragenococcus halophilus]MDN6186895.1 OB-fold nucleic acid binding domain-containing protein [Tetragenococcus halophilus]MDN6744657.1 OB-fold nucleic
MKKIRDLVVDEDFQGFVLIKNADVRTAKNGKTFIAFTFQDTSGSIDGKFWDASSEEIQRFEVGRVVHLTGKREVYQGNPQVRIYKLRLTNPEEPNDPNLFMERAPVKKETMEEEINQVLFEITNPHWNRIVRFLLNKYKREFFEYPAAKKNHHAFVGGLAYHTTTMLHLGKSLVKEYPQLDGALLFSGIILHDLGKVIELSGAMSTEYTVVGNLVGHLVLVNEEITKACLALKIDESAEDIVVLRHMVLAHHGQLDYGSPVRPRIMEAEILHQIDNIDASMQMLTNAISKTEAGDYTERIFGMDNRSFYVPKNSE